MKNFILFLLLILSITTFSQQLTGDELLEKAINFHDPDGNWKTFSGTFFVTMKTPNKPNRESEIVINLPNQTFAVASKIGKKNTSYSVDKENIIIVFNGDKNPSKEILSANKLSKARAKMYQNYYTYLYGLPMKLKDPGTIIHQQTATKKFKGTNYLVLKVTYDKKVGKDTWYFYFNPKTYAMEVYQFFKDQAKNDGEYILLTDLETINGIKIPKNRAWYYNKKDGYLGTDILTLRR
jgi:hypothetical protein